LSHTHTSRNESRPRLSARAFYGVIVAGVVLGALACGAGAWLYLDAGDREPTGRRVWGDVAREFVVPVAVMMGSTFGGLAGFFAAVVWERRHQGSGVGGQESGRHDNRGPTSDP
jgi:hypothetical protein